MEENLEIPDCTFKYEERNNLAFVNNWKQNWLAHNGAVIPEDENQNQSIKRQQQNATKANNAYQEVIDKQKRYELNYKRLMSQEAQAGLLIINSLTSDLPDKYSYDIKGNMISTFKLWSRIKDDYIDLDITQVNNYESEWTSLVINSDEFVKDFGQRIKHLASLLHSVNIAKSEQNQIYKFLQGCTDGDRSDIKTHVIAIKATLDHDSKFDVIIQKLHSLINDVKPLTGNSSKAMSVKKADDSSNDSKKIAAIKKRFNRKLNKFKAKVKKNDSSNDQSKKKIKGYKKDANRFKDVECYYCHEKGHYQNHCPKKPKDSADTAQVNSSSVQGLKDSHINIKVIRINQSTINHLPADSFLMDSGAEMSIVRSINRHINEVKPSNVDLIYGNNNTSKVNFSGKIGTLDVLISKDVSDNILSIPQLTATGRCVIITPDNMVVLKPDSNFKFDLPRDIVDFNGVRRNGLYYCELGDIVDSMADLHIEKQINKVIELSK
jgi:hypothetical protein